jgi:DNA replication protein DnaC
MPSGYLDRAVAARFTHRALTAPGCDIRTMRTIVEWLYEQEEEFELGLPPSLEKLVKRRDKKSARASSHAFGQAYGADRDAILSGLENAAVLPPGSDDPLSDNLELLKWDLGLGEIELGILEIAARYTRVRPFEALCDRLTEGGVPRALACLLGTSRRVVQEAIMPNGSLVRCGVIWVNTEERYIGGSSGYLEITEIIDFNLDRSFEHFDDLRQAILGAPQKANLGWEDFAHLGREGELLSRVLKGAIGRRTKGINILLYGPPGGGKTELCKTLAADLGLTLLSAGETDGSWNEKGRNARLSDLLLAQRMLRRRDNVALMFDEMEDLPVRPWQRDCRSKLFINRLLESNRTPVLWISNTINWIDPAVLRRMTLVVEIKVPGPHARVRLWTRMLRGCAVKVSEQDLASLARETETAPGILSGALTAAELADGGLDELEMAIRGVAKAVNHGRPLPPSRCAETGFEPTLARSDHDLVRLTARLQSSSARAFSLCLSGPSGTGKSAYARHLGAALGLACVQKRASDLLDKWVGESEKAIARAFEEAHDNEALLIFDEAPVGPAPGSQFLGDHPGERDADLDGEPSPAVLLHHQPGGSVGPGLVAPLHLQRRFRLLGPARSGACVPDLLRDRVRRPAELSRGGSGFSEPDARRLRHGAPQGHAPGLRGRPRRTGQDAWVGQRCQAWAKRGHRVLRPRPPGDQVKNLTIAAL